MGVAAARTGKHAVKRALALSTLTLFGSAQAQLRWEGTEGYFRAGVGNGATNNLRECYGLNSPGLKFRHGNECDIYGEATLKGALDIGDVQYKLRVTPAFWTPDNDILHASWGLAQLFVETRGWSFAPEASFWVGKRFYARSEVHIVDVKFTQEDGVGAGIKDIRLGPGDLALAVFHDEGDGRTPALRWNIEYGKLPLNTGGTLRLVGALTKGVFAEGTTGSALTIQHEQANILGLGGSNTAYFQYAQGSANLNTGFGNASAAPDVRGFRLLDAFTWQVRQFGGQAMAMVSKNASNAGDVNAASLGGRLSYALGDHWKLLLELAHSELRPEGQGSQKLNKLSFGPAWATKPEFWSRPEFRLFITTAAWNAAAAGNPSNVLPAGRTHGTTVGGQVEVWW